MEKRMDNEMEAVFVVGLCSLIYERMDPYGVGTWHRAMTWPNASSTVGANLVWN